jgi:hypothetical protein
MYRLAVVLIAARISICADPLVLPAPRNAPPLFSNMGKPIEVTESVCANGKLESVQLVVPVLLP